MTFRDAVFKIERLARENSSSILTALGVSGTITTAYLTAKASFKAASVLAEEPPMDKKETVKTVWKLYIPAVTSGTLTIGCILGASKINARRTAALTAAYSLTEKAYSEYKDKVVETLGEKKEKKVRDDIAADRVAQSSSQGVVVLGTGDVLCYEMYTGRYFTSDMETLRKAQNDINAKLVREMEATLSDFYYLVGLPQTSYSSYSGWKSEKMMSLDFSTHLHDGKPCLAFEYNYITTF